MQFGGRGSKLGNEPGEEKIKSKIQIQILRERQIKPSWPSSN